MADRRPRRAVDAGVKLHIVDVDEKNCLRNRIAALEEQNTNLQRENERVNLEVRQFSNDLAAMTADRDNWRKQALDENSRLEGILQRLRRYLETSDEEERRSKAHMDAYNEKQVAFKELTDFALVPTEGVVK